MVAGRHTISEILLFELQSSKPSNKRTNLLKHKCTWAPDNTGISRVEIAATGVVWYAEQSQLMERLFACSVAYSAKPASKSRRSAWARGQSAGGCGARRMMQTVSRRSKPA